MSTRKTENLGVFLRLYPRIWVKLVERIRRQNTRVVHPCQGFAQPYGVHTSDLKPHPRF
ncbi:hypothetical protein [Brasilonema sp. UFV-L1]|uniref:hypothetical protein n=1 Tax=Brasilonema sp. UFV-L1 TaxID=2234130 RepID=UPI00145C6F66|nr:hypothetical protein [Brasilonema sp. UFV-L1]